MFHVPWLLLSVVIVAVAAMLLWSLTKRFAADRTQRLNDQRRDSSHRVQEQAAV